MVADAWLSGMTLKMLPKAAPPSPSRGSSRPVRPSRRSAKGSISGSEADRRRHDGRQQLVDLALSDRIDGGGRRTHQRIADDAATDQQLLVDGVEDVAALVAQPVHRHDGGVEPVARSLLVARLEGVPDRDEI